MKRVSWFKDLTLNDRPTVGGKGASLGELTRAGITVPPGFVVTTAAFESYLTEIDPEGEIRAEIRALGGADLSAINEKSKQIRALFEVTPMSGGLLADITAAYARLCAGDAKLPVAIRSSATSEDSADASFAGLQDTFLWVMGAEEVEKHIRTCWSSLYSAEAVSYRQRLNLPENQVAMAVVVQTMVNARTSGVMFTRSPTTGDRSVIAIDASWGLGSCIVSGEVTPDSFVISKITGEISKRTISEKAMQHVPLPDEGGVREEEVPAHRQTIQCVTDDELMQLSEIARKVEAHYGCPQDIEWSITGEGEAAAVYLLQSRPETVWANKERAPVAKPKAKATDHVFAFMAGKRT